MIDTIVCGNAYELAADIPDHSVDMIFTDPVYERTEDYAWLAQQALRVLKPDSAVLVWCSNVGQYPVQAVMSQFLTFVLPLTYTKVAKTYKAFGYKTFLWSTPCLWFTNGKPNRHDWLIDTIIEHSNAIVSTDTPPSDSYKWHKNPEAYRKWLIAFTQPGDVVWDPFTGTGSLPMLCREYGRHFYASEIDPQVAAKGNRRLDQVPQPLPGLEVLEQRMVFASDWEGSDDDTARPIR